jgi:hypothetical protein
MQPGLLSCATEDTIAPLRDHTMTQQGILGSPEWTMRVEHRRRADGRVYCSADVFRVGVFVVRISLHDPVGNKIAAEVTLANKARKWISSYEATEHTGGTDFGELENV